MTHSMNRFIFVIIIIFSFSLNLFATDKPFQLQEVNIKQKDFYADVYMYAKTLSDNGLRKEAALEYKRYLFLQRYDKGIYKEQCLEYLVDYYDEYCDYKTALDFQQMLLEESYSHNENNQIRIDNIIKREIILMQKIYREYVSDKDKLSDSYINLNKIRLFSLCSNEEESESVKLFATTSLFIDCVRSEKWDEVQTLYKSLIINNPAIFSEREMECLEKNIDSALIFKKKNPMTAAYLSLVPGVGQLYAHNIRDSLNAFIINGSLIALSAYSLANLNFTDFFMFEINPLYRFYTGNIYNAQKDVYRYNDEKIALYKKNIIQILLNWQQKNLTAFCDNPVVQ